MNKRKKKSNLRTHHVLTEPVTAHLIKSNLYFTQFEKLSVLYSKIKLLTKKHDII